MRLSRVHAYTLAAFVVGLLVTRAPKPGPRSLGYPVTVEV